MDLNDAERYAVAALFTLALHSTHVRFCSRLLSINRAGHATIELLPKWLLPNAVFELLNDHSYSSCSDAGQQAHTDAASNATACRLSQGSTRMATRCQRATSHGVVHQRNSLMSSCCHKCHSNCHQTCWTSSGAGTAWLLQD